MDKTPSGEHGKMTRRAPHHDIQRVIPLPQTVVQSHVEPGLPHTCCKVTNQVPLGPLVNTVPVPVVGVGEVAPSLMVLGGEDNICVQAGKIRSHTCIIICS